MSGSRAIKRLLIANRGEIACRIVATCRAMGIETVTLYADDDRDLPHARAGDIAVRLEGATLADTYLNIDKIIAAAKATQADAIHPGYGFLSENARFAEAVTKAGLIFVGPPAAVVAKMGDKAESRLLCQSIGVPTVPGYEGRAMDTPTLHKEAEKIGFPILVKASAGGGGKGMRIVHSATELDDALTAARAEAKNAFGDDRLLMEKYITQPRHVEIQVFSDMHGNHLHLFERDCSIQRRYQKIIEESPAPYLPETTRQKMAESAIKLTKHIGYVGAGTVEFILASNGDFYFLEMNTRLQVEHPVTEMVTGLDLVRLQIEVAEGKKIPFTQKDVHQKGHAIEVRLYAENTEQSFMPAPGTLSAFATPHLPLTRCESGYATGNVVSASYDPMVAKLVSWGTTRDEAINRLHNLLAQTRMDGVANNRVFLMRVLNEPDFRAGKVSTAFISQHPALLTAPVLSQDALAALAAGYLLFAIGKTTVSATHAIEQSAWTNSRLAGAR